MNNIVNLKQQEEDEIGEYLEEPLEKGLLEAFNRLYKNKVCEHTGFYEILEEAHRQSRKLNDDIDSQTFHYIYEDAKCHLGSYSAASASMMLLYAILACKRYMKRSHLLLMDRIEEKYRLRPFMTEIIQLAREERGNDMQRLGNRNVSKHNNNMKDNLDSLKGLFEGGNFPNAQINVLTGDGVQISYQANKGADKQEPVGQRQAVMDYVNRLMPVVAEEYKEDYSRIWLEILEEDAVSRTVYDRGRQKGTVFNRNLVAQISRMMMLDGIILKETNDVMMAQLLEPEKGRNHPVRNQLGLVPEDSKVKKAVEEVFRRHGVKV